MYFTASLINPFSLVNNSDNGWKELRSVLYRKYIEAEFESEELSEPKPTRGNGLREGRSNRCAGVRLNLFISLVCDVGRISDPILGVREEAGGCGLILLICPNHNSIPLIKGWLAGNNAVANVDVE